MKKIILMLGLFGFNQDIYASEVLWSVAKTIGYITLAHGAVISANIAAIQREEFADPQGCYHLKADELTVDVHDLSMSTAVITEYLEAFSQGRQPIFYDPVAKNMSNKTIPVALIGLVFGVVPVIGIIPSAYSAWRAHSLAAQVEEYAKNPCSPASVARRIELNLHRAHAQVIERKR